MLSISLIALLGIALLVMVINLPVHVMLKFFFGVVLMFGVSKLLAGKLKMKDDWGMLMVRSQAGLRVIEKLAKSEAVWKAFADIGTVVAYGLASFFIIRRPLKERAVIMFVGFCALTLISLIVAPVVFPFLLSNLGAEGLAAKSAEGSGSALLAGGLIYTGGFALGTFASLLTYTGVIASAAIGTLFFGTSELAKTAPGATLILPGINIHFAEGVIALALILVVHEGAHAVLARIAKTKILSSGVVFFGIIPVGAFVEPDEEQLKKLDKEKQTRVLVAGSAANFFASLTIFLVFLAFLYGTMSFKEDGLLIVGGNQSGSVIYRINGQDASEFLATANNTTKYNSTLTFETSAGTYETTIGKGQLHYYDLGTSFFIARYGNPALDFVYNLLGLAFSLNFVIGAVNLLPLPLFDGYRLLEINVDKKIVVTAVSWVAALAFILNFLPWAF